MENKQTAVDWLVSQVKKGDKSFDEYFRGEIQQAKAMEKEQIIDAYDNGGDHYTETGKAIWGKDYYNETYKQQDNNE